MMIGSDFGAVSRLIYEKGSVVEPCLLRADMTAQ